MKVLGVLLSPRRGGNSAALLEAFLEGAAAAGAETELVDFPKLDVGGCRGCNACKEESQQCILQDDMQALYDKVAEADVIAQASPVYFDGITAQAKTFLDRLYRFIGLNQERWMPEGKRGAYFLDWEAGPDMPYGKTLDWWKGRFEYYFRIETAYALGVDSTGENPVSEREDFLGVVREAGGKVALGEAAA